MAKTIITFTKSWDRVKAYAVAGKFSVELKKNLAKATKLNAMYLRKHIRKQLRSGMKPPNAPLTVAVKGSSKPGIDKGELFKAITYKVLTPYTAEVGVLKGDKNANIAIAFHEGATIPVTPAMRGLFAALASASQGKATHLGPRAQELFGRYKSWKPLLPSTTHIKIPGRPFIKQALEDPLAKMKIYGNWHQALLAAASMTGKPPYLKM